MTGSASIGDIRRSLGMTEEDAARLRSAAERLRPEIEGWVDAFYARLICDPAAMAILGDEARVLRLKRSLTAWFHEILEVPQDDDYALARRAIGDAHVRIGMPQYLMVTSMGGVRRDVADSVARAWVADPAEGARVAATLDRALDLELALMLQAYGRRLDDLRRREDRTRALRRLSERLDAAARDAVDAAHCYAFLLARRPQGPRGLWAARLADALRSVGRAVQPEDDEDLADGPRRPAP